MPDEKTNPTEAETAAAEAAKKAAAAAAGAGEKEPTAAELKAALEDSKAHIAKLNKENEKHRKAHAETSGKLDKLAELFGGSKEPDEVTKKVAEAKGAAEGKLKRSLLRSAVVAEVAKDAHDANDVFAMLDLADVEVDVDAEKVDTKALKEKVSTLRKSKPYLFVQANSGGGGKGTNVQPPPDNSGQPKGGGSQYATWRQLKASGKDQEANEFYQANRKAILAQSPRD